MFDKIKKKLNRRSANSSSSSTGPSAGPSTQAPYSTKVNEVILRVDVLQARNVAAKDWNGKSDPYAIVIAGEEQHQTHVVSETLNPQWNTSFDLTVAAESFPEEVSIELWDKDRFRSDFLGDVVIPINHIFNHVDPTTKKSVRILPFDHPENKPQWYTLQSRRKNEKVSGDVELKFGLVNEPLRPDIRGSDGSSVDVPSPTSNAKTSADWEAVWDELLREAHSVQVDIAEDDAEAAAADSEVPKENKAASKAPEGKGAKKQDASLTLSNGKDEVLGVLFIEITSAADLPREKSFTRLTFDMDPFVIASFGRKTYRTNAIRHSLDPSWNEKLYFHIRPHELNYDVRFAVYDKDKITGNDLVGWVEVKANEIVQKGSSAAASEKEKAQKEGLSPSVVDEELDLHTLPLTMAPNKKWDKHSPTLTIRVKYIPYATLRRRFWGALARIYDTDENGSMSKVEIQTMLESIGSTLSEKTVDSFFTRYGKKPDGPYGAAESELTFDELNDCFEDVLAQNMKEESHLKNPDVPKEIPHAEDSTMQRSSSQDSNTSDSLEKIVRLSECPICHSNLKNQSEVDMITHVAICASDDWTKVDHFILGNFVTEAYAQRKWFVKLVETVGYGKYTVGGNNANIIVQNRATGQLEEEKMAVYLRVGMRLLYRGMGTSVERKSVLSILKNMSIKQGKKFDDPASVKEIKPFIAFHNLNTDEMLDPIDSFKNFNEFFYRKLKPGMRPPDSPDDPTIAVAAADSRMMVFNTISHATDIWIKGKDFTVQRLLGLPADDPLVQSFEGGALAIFRLAPQDYHRFHVPIDGVIDGEPRQIDGQYYTVNPMAIRTNLDVYGENIRTIVIINSPQFGRVALACIGAMMVGSTIITAKPGQQLKKGDELGFFKFGGSTVIALFPKGKLEFDDDLIENSNRPMETLVRVGNHIGKIPK